MSSRYVQTAQRTNPTFPFVKLMIGHKTHICNILCGEVLVVYWTCATQLCSGYVIVVVPIIVVVQWSVHDNSLSMTSLSSSSLSILLIIFFERLLDFSLYSSFLVLFFKRLRSVWLFLFFERLSLRLWLYKTLSFFGFVILFFEQFLLCLQVFFSYSLNDFVFVFSFLQTTYLSSLLTSLSSFCLLLTELLPSWTEIS